MLLAGQGSVAALRGAADVAEQRWDEAIVAATRDENRWYESIIRVMRADFTATDHPARAVEDARCALDYFSWAGEEWWVHWARTALIAGHRASGAVATAAELARRLLAAPLTPLERGARSWPTARPCWRSRIRRRWKCSRRRWTSSMAPARTTGPPGPSCCSRCWNRPGASAHGEHPRPGGRRTRRPGVGRLAGPGHRARDQSTERRPARIEPTAAEHQGDRPRPGLRGFTSRQAAAALLISPSTVDTHIRATMEASGSRTRAQAAAAQHEPRPSDTDEAPTLGRDELATLELLAAGRTIAQVADELHYSRRTVERRLAALRERIGVATNRGLVAHAHELRIV